VLRWVWFSVRLGLSTGITGGAIVGLIAGLGGSVFTSTLPDLANFAVGAFWLVLPGLPLVYRRNLAVLEAMVNAGELFRARTSPMTMIAWLLAYVSCVVAFMIPVVIVPIVLNKGVSVDTSARWYDQVYTALLAGPVVLAGIATLFGFAAVAYFSRPRTRIGSV
jgi:hypothetical protein